MHPIVKRVFRGINRNIVAISLVSFLNDISSEMIYPVVPIFLVSVLNAPVTVVGLIEGIAEATANLMRVFSGYFSDRFQKRKPFMIAGYSLSTLSKLVIAAATGWTMILGARFLDRFGKGVRTAARDALLAGASQENYRGKVFGFHRALDTLGAMAGPLAAFFLLRFFEDNLRMIFYIAFVPAVAGVILLAVFVRDIRKNIRSSSGASWTLRNVRLTRGFKIFLVVSIIFALGNSSDAFLILRANNLGFSVGTTILAYTLFNVVYAIFSFPAGIISIEIVADVRTIPRSRHNPQFNAGELEHDLKKHGVRYLHLKELGGLRHASKTSVNTGWENLSFRGFADYMQTPEFAKGIEMLIDTAHSGRTVVMCAEAVPWRCHRWLIADALAIRGIAVVHIMGMKKSMVHTITQWAKWAGNTITYP